MGGFILRALELLQVDRAMRSAPIVGRSYQGRAITKQNSYAGVCNIQDMRKEILLYSNKAQISVSE